jgi:hypothetical protein
METGLVRLDPEIGWAAGRVLARNGVEVIPALHTVEVLDRAYSRTL